MDDRDLNIKTQGYLKSIIESGMAPDAWEAHLREALKIHERTVNWQKQCYSKKKVKNAQ